MNMFVIIKDGIFIRKRAIFILPSTTEREKIWSQLSLTIVWIVKLRKKKVKSAVTNAASVSCDVIIQFSFEVDFISGLRCRRVRQHL